MICLRARVHDECEPLLIEAIRGLRGRPISSSGLVMADMVMIRIESRK